jgi:hypothetical protein
LNEDELRYLVIAVKNHVVNSAKKVVNDQLWRYCCYSG